MCVSIDEIQSDTGQRGLMYINASVLLSSKLWFRTFEKISVFQLGYRFFWFVMSLRGSICAVM